PFLLLAFPNSEPDYGWFAQVISDYEDNVLGHDLPGIYRDSRGMLYVPHAGLTVALGTREVETLKRPEWCINKILYSEKEGLLTILREEFWPEWRDCAVLTSKGYAVRAVGDALRIFGNSKEPLIIYVIHDCDGYGTLIYEKLCEMVKKGREQHTDSRPIEIINLGLEVAEVQDMGLEVEDLPEKSKAVACADYVSDEDREWLQEHRCELNSMTTPEFLEWLDEKFKGQPGKVIPPP